MKKCTKCKVEKVFGEFYKNRGKPDGLMVRCIECCREYNRSVDRKEAWANYQKTEKGKATKRKYQQSVKGRVCASGYRSKYPYKTKAHDKVKCAIRSGVLVRPDRCFLCLKVCHPHAHHCDYNKPLDIMWLCKQCHVDWHKENEAIPHKDA